MIRARFLLALLLFADPVLAGEPKRDRFGDPLPEGAVARLGTINAHPGVRSIAFSADGKTLRTIGTSSVREWDMTTGRIRRIISIPHTVRHPVDAERRPEGISENGRIAVRIVGKQLEVIELEPFKVSHRAATIDDCVCAVSRDGQWAILSCEYPGFSNFEIRILDMETGKSEKWKDFAGSPDRFIFSPDSKLVATGPRSGDGGIQCRQLSTGRLSVFGSDYLTPLAFSSDSKRVAVAAFDGKSLEVWDIEQRKRVHESKIRPGGRFGAGVAALNADGSILATSGNNRISIWDVATGKRIRSWRGTACCMAFSPDGKRLATSNELVQLWDVATGKPLLPDFGPLVGLEGGWSVLSNTANGQIAAWSRYSGKTCIWDYSSGTPIRSHIIDHYCIHRLWLSPDANRLISIDDPAFLINGHIRKVKVRVWDTATGAELSHLLPIPPTEKRIWKPLGIRVVENGQTIALAMKYDDFGPTGPGLFVRWDLEAKKLIESFRFPLSDDVYTVEVDPNGRAALLGGRRFDLNCPNGGRVLLPRDGDALDSIQEYICADSRLLLGDTQFTNPTVFEMASGRPLLRVPKVGKDIHYWAHHLAVSPDGRWLALARYESIELWDIAEGKQVPFHKPHRIADYSDPEEYYCCDLQFLPDGKHLIAAHGDATALVWELPPEALKPPSQRMTSRAWDDLASLDARVGCDTVWAMWNEPAKALALLIEKLKPATMPPAKELAALIEELGAKEFARREEAMKRLRTYGRTIESALRDAASRTANAEQKKRLNELLSGYQSVASRTPEEIRAIRCVQVLEKLKDPEAKHLLRELAKGEPSAILTQEARKASEK